MLGFEGLYTIGLNKEQLIYIIKAVKRNVAYCKAEKKHISSSNEDDELNKQIEIGEELLSSWINMEDYDI